MDLDGTKYLAMVLLGGISLILGFIPLKIGKYFVNDDKVWKRTLTSVLLCFGGGVLFATAMIHMIPEVSKYFNFLLSKVKYIFQLFSGGREFWRTGRHRLRNLE